MDLFQQKSPLETKQEPPKESQPEIKKIRKETIVRAALRITIHLAIIALGIFVILVLVAKAAQYDSVSSMLNHMFTELALMWERILA